VQNPRRPARSTLIRPRSRPPRRWSTGSRLPFTRRPIPCNGVCQDPRLGADSRQRDDHCAAAPPDAPSAAHRSTRCGRGPRTRRSCLREIDSLDRPAGRAWSRTSSALPQHVALVCTDDECTAVPAAPRACTHVVPEVRHRPRTAQRSDAQVRAAAGVKRALRRQRGALRPASRTRSAATDYISRELVANTRRLTSQDRRRHISASSSALDEEGPSRSSSVPLQGAVREVLGPKPARSSTWCRTYLLPPGLAT